MSVAQKPKRKWRLTRRGFLIGLGAVGGGLAVGITLGRAPFYRFMASQLDGAAAPGSLPNEPTAWFEILPDNTVTVYVSKVEMGQGIHTSIAQIAAEELEVPWENVRVKQGSTKVGPADSFGTGGSNSISTAFQPAREAAAMMRQMLLIEGARQLGVSAADAVAQDGKIMVRGKADQSLTFGEVVADVTAWPEVEEIPALKDAADFRFIGQSMPRVDFESKLTGQAIYGYDVRVPDMLYGAVARPRTIGGKMISASEGSVRERDGVVEVVIDVEAGFAGVVAKTRQQAISAARQLNVEWEEGPAYSQADIEARVNFDSNGYTIQKEGNAPAALGDEPTLEAEYFTPLAVHAHLEPQAAMVHYMGDKALVYGSTQSQSAVLGDVAEILELDEAQVEVVPTYLGGGFGRRLNIEAANEAARLSKVVQQPVHVGWSRPEDMQHGYFRPPTRSRLEGKLENGRITAVNHLQASGEVAFPFFPPPLRLIFGTDFGSWRGAFNFYEGIPNRNLTAYLSDLPIRTGWWRGLGLLANVFATECFMDEMAVAAGADPLQFRLDHLGDDLFGERMKGVLRTVGERSGWGNDLPEGRALGIACSPDVDTVVAMVSEISVSDSGQIKVHKTTMAVDPGLVVNPDGAEAQSQGSIVMGLSSTLIEEINVSEGRIKVSNFDRYPLLTMDMTPEMEIIMLESDGVPRGMGEPPIGPVAASVGNAFYALTGKRLRRLPFTPERVLEALNN